MHGVCALKRRATRYARMVDFCMSLAAAATAVIVVPVCVDARKCKNSTTHLSGFHKKHMACTHNNTRKHSIDSPLYKLYMYIYTLTTLF